MKQNKQMNGFLENQNHQESSSAEHGSVNHSDKTAVMEHRKERREKSERMRGNDIGSYAETKSSLATMHCEAALGKKGLDTAGVKKIIDASRKLFGKALGTLGFVAAISGGMEFSPLSTLSAEAAVLKKNSSSIEHVAHKGPTVQVVEEYFQSLLVLQNSQRDDAQTLVKHRLARLTGFAEKYPAVFEQFIEEEYVMTDDAKNSGRTFQENYGLSRENLLQAISDPSYRHANIDECLLALMQSDDTIHLTLGSNNGEVNTRAYPSQVYKDTPDRTQAGRMVERKNTWTESVNGHEYEIRADASYSDEGALKNVDVFATPKNLDESFSGFPMMNAQDERATLLSQDVQNKLQQYFNQESTDIPFNLDEYAALSTNLLARIHALNQLEKAGHSDEAQKVAEDTGAFVGTIEKKMGDDFFDYNTFPAPLRQLLEEQHPSVLQQAEKNIEQVVGTYLGRKVDSQK